MRENAENVGKTTKKYFLSIEQDFHSKIAHHFATYRMYTKCKAALLTSLSAKHVC